MLSVPKGSRKITQNKSAFFHFCLALEQWTHFVRVLLRLSSIMMLMDMWLPHQGRVRLHSPGKEGPWLRASAKHSGSTDKTGHQVCSVHVSGAKGRNLGRGHREKLTQTPVRKGSSKEGKILLLTVVSRKIRQGSVDPLVLFIHFLREVKEMDLQGRRDVSRPAEADSPAQPGTGRPLWLPWKQRWEEEEWIAHFNSV